MRRFLFAMILGVVTGTVYGDDGAHVVQKFNGMDTNMSTTTFTVADKWEVLWVSLKPINITLLSADGTVVTGFHGSGRGSFYQAKGGTYYLQLNSDHPEIKAPWQFIVVEVGSGTTLTGADANPMISNPNDPNYAPPTTVLSPSTSAPPTTKNGAVVQQFPFGVPLSGQPNMTATPAAPSTSAATPAATPAPIVKLTEAQARAVVLIKGDNTDGTGFMVKTPDGPVIVTNIHMLANNPNLKFTTTSGAQITVLSVKAADDRDLAMVSIKDAGYTYLDLSPDVSQSVQPGDEVITPGNSQGGGVVLNTPGKVLGIGPDRVEFDNPIYHGNSGGPIFHTKSGKVVGVVTEGIKVEMTNDLDKASFASRNSAITGSMRYFGLRLDTVPNWLPVDWNRFQNETAFLDKFNLQSRSLDSYLNPPTKGSSSSANSDSDAKLYLDDDKITRARNHFIEMYNNDASHRVEALKELIFDLNDVADSDMDYVQDMNNFQPFDRDRAKDALDYRKALKDELDAISNNVTRLDRLQ